MARKNTKVENNIEKVLDYIGLDLNKVPSAIEKFEPLEYRVSKAYNDSQYKQYRYVNISDVEILLSPTNRMDDLEKRYKNASPLYEYLDSKTEENIIKHTTFLSMLKQTKIEDIQKIEEEQEKLNKKIPFKVKFEGNYLWQIYYSENTDKYFMLVPTEDSDYTTFFYLLKKKIENQKNEKIFVPIRNVEYSKKFLKKSEFEDLGNYLWLFTKDWGLIYEVYDKKDEMSIQIIGETEVYGNLKSPYKIKLTDKIEALKFYKLLKAMFIMQTELPHYFNFITSITKTGDIEFYFKDIKMVYEDLADFVNDEYNILIQKIKIADELILENRTKLDALKLKATELDIEYLAKEKQITTFLECKKSFFGKFKYYFKYSKGKNKNKIKNFNKEDYLETEKEDPSENTRNKKERQKSNYTIEELIEKCKEYEIQENEMKNLIMDINAIKLKNKNTEMKIENASKYIQEIDEHKKSIFEFWKYTNKDEIATLPEGEEEEVNVIKKISKVFDYKQDFENFGKSMDKLQRKKLSKEETDAIYIATTDLINLLNEIKTNKVGPKDIEKSLKDLKKEATDEKTLTQNDEFDVFGAMIDDNRKIKKINNKSHRELPKDKYKILEISKNAKTIGYKLRLEDVIEKIKTSIDKIDLTEDIVVYKALPDIKLKKSEINVFNIDPEKEMKSVIDDETGKINFYKLNLKKDSKILAFSNIIYFDNQNKTLPIGMNLDTRVVVDISKLKINVVNKSKFKIVEFENEKDDFTDIKIKNVNVFEYDIEN